MKKPLISREADITILAFLWLFILMTGYYIIKPIRDGLANELPKEAYPYLLISVMVVALFYNFIYDILARLLPSAKLIVVVTLFFVLCLTVFSVALNYTWPEINLPFLGLQPGRYVCIVAYFLFVGVYSVFTVTLFWSFVNEIFYSCEARNSFGKITAGGTSGGLLGSFLTTYFAPKIHLGYLLIISAFLLLITLIFMKYLISYRKDEQKDEKKDEAECELSRESGFNLIMNSSYLRWLLLAMFLTTSSSTLLSYQMNAIVKYSIHGDEARTAFWAYMNFWVNGLGLFFQLVVIQWMVKRFSITPVLLLAPIVDITGSVFLIGSQTLSIGAPSHIGKFSSEYSFNRASKEMLYTPTSRDFKYQAKAIIDIFIFRAGDGLTSLLLILLQQCSCSLRGIAVISLFINIFRIIPALVLSKDYKVLISNSNEIIDRDKKI